MFISTPSSWHYVCTGGGVWLVYDVPTCGLRIGEGVPRAFPFVPAELAAAGSSSLACPAFWTSPEAQRDADPLVFEWCEVPRPALE